MYPASPTFAHLTPGSLQSTLRSWQAPQFAQLQRFQASAAAAPTPQAQPEQQPNYGTIAEGLAGALKQYQEGQTSKSFQAAQTKADWAPAGIYGLKQPASAPAAPPATSAAGSWWPSWLSFGGGA